MTRGEHAPAITKNWALGHRE